MNREILQKQTCPKCNEELAKKKKKEEDRELD